METLARVVVAVVLVEAIQEREICRDSRQTF
jgi:hypothetical protein